MMGDMEFTKIDFVPRPERRSEGNTKIYALVDPRDDTVRYVGKTMKHPEERLREHLENPTNRRTRAWFFELAEARLTPYVEILQRVRHGWETAEMQWIAWFRARGDLLNVDDGGMLYEEGSGWDEIKRAKADLFLATAQAFSSSFSPPPCAQDTRTRSQKHKDRSRAKKAQQRGEERARKNRERVADNQERIDLVAREDAARAEEYARFGVGPRICRRSRQQLV